MPFPSDTAPASLTLLTVNIDAANMARAIDGAVDQMRAALAAQLAAQIAGLHRHAADGVGSVTSRDNEPVRGIILED